MNNKSHVYAAFNKRPGEETTKYCFAYSVSNNNGLHFLKLENITSRKMSLFKNILNFTLTRCI